MKSKFKEEKYVVVATYACHILILAPLKTRMGTMWLIVGRDIIF